MTQQVFLLKNARNRADRRRSKMFTRSGVTSPVLRAMGRLVLAAFVALIIFSAVAAFAGKAEAQMCASSDLASVESALIEQNAKKRDAGNGKVETMTVASRDVCVYAENSECTHASVSHDEMYYDASATLQQRFSTAMASKCCTSYTTPYQTTTTCSGSLWEFWYDGGTTTGISERTTPARVAFNPSTREYVVRPARRDPIYFALVGGRYSTVTQPAPSRYEVYCPSNTPATGALAFWEETQYFNFTERAVSTYAPPIAFGSPRTETYVSKTSNRRRHMCPEDNPCPWLVLTEGGKG